MISNIINWVVDLGIGAPLIAITANPELAQEIDGLYNVIKDEHPVSRTLWITFIVLCFGAKLLGYKPMKGFRLREFLKIKKKKKDSETKE